MLWVVVYDVPEDPIRNRVADVLEGYGKRVQKSVFECRLDPDAVEALMGRLEVELRRSDGGGVRFYRLCELCQSAAMGIGRLEGPDDEGALIF